MSEEGVLEEAEFYNITGKETIKEPQSTYSSVPNRRVGRNKRAGGNILKKTLNVQDIINVQGGKFS